MCMCAHDYPGESRIEDSDARSPRMIRRVDASSDIASSRLRAELTYIYGKVTRNLRRIVFAFDCRPRGSGANGFFLSPLLTLLFSFFHFLSFLVLACLLIFWRVLASL